MVADQNRTVHTMNSRTVGRGSIDITYRQWTAERGWTEPVDVLLSPKKDIARLRGIALDDQGYLNVVFYGGDEQDASMYYTYAPVTEADRARAWAPPREIAPFAGPINDGAMIGDGQDGLYVVYTGTAEGMGAYATYSLDGGVTWSDPEQVHASAMGQWPTHYGLYLDQDGRLHAAWSEADSTGTGQLLYYARLDIDQGEWTTPVILAERELGVDYEVDWPTLVMADNELLLIFQDATPASKWMRTSTDGGTTWTPAERVFSGHVGENGRAVTVTDSAGTLHLLVAHRTTGNPAVHGLWHSVWRTAGWTPLEPAVTGYPVSDPIGGTGFDPVSPQAVVSNGDLLLAMWTTDPMAVPNGVFYTYSQLDAPELPVVPLPTVIPASTPVPTPAPTPVASSPTPLPQSREPSAQLPGASARVGDSLLLGLLPVLVLLGGVILVRGWRRPR